VCATQQVHSMQRLLNYYGFLLDLAKRGLIFCGAEAVCFSTAKVHNDHKSSVAPSSPEFNLSGADRSHV